MENTIFDVRRKMYQKNDKKKFNLWGNIITSIRE